jgi:hypothetical protein
MSTPAPAVTPTLAISADKAVYAVGDPIVITAKYSDSSVAPVQMNITASASDAAGNTVNAEISVTVNTAQQQPMTIGITDSFGGSYTVQSNAAGVAVLDGVIGTPPAPPAA